MSDIEKEKMVSLIEEIDDLVKQHTISSSIASKVDDMIEEWKESLRPKQKVLDEVDIIIKVQKCNECPFSKTERTQGAGYAIDRFCGPMSNKKVGGYIEWERDEPCVPEWCPYRNKKDLGELDLSGDVDEE